MPTRPVGRPSTYQPQFCDLIIQAMAGGLSAEAAAVSIGISARSVFNWQREHPEFLQAIQEGRVRGLAWWEKRAIEMAQGAPGNTQIVVLALKNRSRAASGWVDTQKVELAGSNCSPLVEGESQVLDITDLNQEEREQLRALLEKAAGSERPKRIGQS